MDAFIEGLPKAGLHIHIEGSLEPEMMFALAERNGVDLPFASVEELRAAYSFQGLQGFLDIYYQGARVLRTERDFFDLTWAYLEKAHKQIVLHTEIFFDPQVHTWRGVPFANVFGGVHRAMGKAETELGPHFQTDPVFPAPPGRRRRHGDPGSGARATAFSRTKDW